VPLQSGPGTDAAMLISSGLLRPSEPGEYASLMNSSDEDALCESVLAVAAGQAEHASDGAGVGVAGLADDGAILAGVWIDAMVDSACLCAVTGPISEAHRTNRKLTAIICVRWTRTSGLSVLAACGVCQERLAVFGSDLLIGVADNAERGFRFESLAALRASPWWDSIGAEKSTN
jgi:cytidine deaminase